MKIGPRVEDDVYQLLEEYLDATPLAVTQVLVVNQALREFLTPRIQQIRQARGQAAVPEVPPFGTPFDEARERLQQDAAGQAATPTTTEGEASGSADEGTRAG